MNADARAIEAILMVAEDPVEPQLLAQLLEVPPRRVEELCAELQAAYEDERARLRARARRRRLPVPEPSRSRALCRALRARGAVGAAVGGRARDACHRRVQAAGQPCPGVRHPRRERRRRDAHACSSAGSIEEIARDPGPGLALLYGTTRLFLERLGLDSLDDLPSLGDFVPGAEVVEALEQGLRPDSLDAE